MKFRLVLLIFIFNFENIFTDEVWQVLSHPFIEEKEFVTLVEPSRILHLSSEVSGKLIKAPFEIGQQIKQGDSFSIDDELYKMEVHLERKILEELKVRRDEVKKNLLHIESELNFYSKKWRRNQSLFKSQSISIEEYESVEKEYLRAKNNSDKVQSLFSISNINIEKQEIKVKLVETILKKYKTKLPEKWTVIEKYHEEGALVRANEKVVSLADLKEMKVVFYFTPEEIMSLKKVKNIEVGIGEWEGKKYSVLLHGISPTVDPVTQKSKVEFRLNNELNDFLFSGFHAKLKLPKLSKNTYFKVPKGYYKVEYEQYYLKGVDEKVYPVEIIKKQNGYIIIQKDQILQLNLKKFN